MKFDELLEIVGSELLFETGLLLAGDVDVGDVRRQLSRWVTGGRLHQLRRGLYSLAPPFRKAQPHSFLVANALVRGSYVSSQSALSRYGLIPEYVPVTTSVGPMRPHRRETPLGTFDFRHLGESLRSGFEYLAVTDSQFAFVATPEKALLDLVHLSPGGDSREFLSGLRLQNLDELDLDRLKHLAEEVGKPKLLRAAKEIAELAEVETLEFAPL